MRWFRRLLTVAVGFVILVVALAAAVQFVGAGSIGQGRLRAEVQRALTALAGFEVKADMQDLRLVLSDRSLIALEVRGLKLSRVETGDTLVDADVLRFGFKLLPLLHGEIEVGSAELDGARVDVNAFGSGPSGETGEPIWARAIEPQQLRAHVFEALRRVYDITERTGTRYLTLKDVLIGSADEAVNGTKVDLRVSLAPAGKLDFDGQLTDGQRVTSLSGKVRRPLANGPIRSFSLNASLPGRSTTGVSLLDSVIGTKGEHLTEEERRIGSLEVSLEGAEEALGVSSLALTARFEDAVLDLGEDGRLVASGDVAAKIDESADMAIIDRAVISVGRSRFAFGGRFGLKSSALSDEPVYAFELISADSAVAPIDSPEAEVPFAARIIGRIEVEAGRIVGDEIRVVTGTGQISASAAVTLEKGKTPGLSLAVYASGMPTSHVKQFWPWFAATGARKWALSNLFGGWVDEGNLRLRVPPGRLGDGNPLGDDEVSGEFTVSGTRFDVAGRIPPVRDGEGKVAFKGSDVDITIDSGTVYMPTGRSVAASNGVMRIRDAHLKPRIGKLQLDVAGDASAVVELATYEPIDVSRIINLQPADVSGDVTGHIVADIPLSDGIPRSTLGWRVTLEYEGLSIAKPFDGQSVTDAKGVAVIEPERAEISASASLNGAPAQLELVEPLNDETVVRQRDITLTLDDKARKKLLPGLGDILSGPTEITYKELDAGRRKIDVKLDAAQLSLPWMNWRKGKGIAGTASFVMEQKDDRLDLSEFVLKGKTFSVRGSLSLAGGELLSARFDAARLNRGDDFAASVRQRGGAYAVRIRGAALDARSIVKHYLGLGPGGSGSRQGATVAVKLDAKVNRLAGFNGETLHDVALSYSGDGRNPGQMEISATTRNGGGFSLSRGAGAIRASSNDAGAVMRFVDFYANVEGGAMQLALREEGNSLIGTVTAESFFIVDEPRLRSLVAATETRGPDGQVDATRLRFDRGFANIMKSGARLELANGVLRGPLIGTTFQGLLFDADDNVSITGTFMPLYGLNRIFGEIPLFGGILGNGRDRGLIGITYRLFGKLSAPQFEANPISAIAPGILRQIFEYR